MPVWTLTFERPGRLGAGEAVERMPVSGQVGPQLFRCGVLLADLANLAADAYRHVGRLDLADNSRHLRRALVVGALLFIDGWLGKVDQRRRVDIDVPVADADGIARCLLDGLGGAFRIGGVLAGVELVVVALYENRATPAGMEAAGQNAGDVLARPLIRVLLLAARELEDQRRGVDLVRCATHRRGHVEDLCSQVDRRDREAAHFAAAAGQIQVVDAGRWGAQGL